MLDLKSLVPWGQKNLVPDKKAGETDPFSGFRHDLDRLFDRFFDGIAGFGGSIAPRDSMWSAAMPTIDVEEKGKDLIITAELPGVDEKDINVSIQGDVLTIHGEKKHSHEEKNDERFYTERRYGSFTRSLRLPFDAGNQKIEGAFDKGVLTVSIPKPKDWMGKTRRIEIKSHTAG